MKVFLEGFFSLVQVFVAMQPEEAVYFANPGEGVKFNKAFYFHWANSDNEPTNEWHKVILIFVKHPNGTYANCWVLSHCRY